MSTPSSRTLRWFWLKVHLYLGLFAGLVFVLIALTGSVLVFHNAIDEALNPELLTVGRPGVARPLDEIVAAATAASSGDFSLLMAPRTEQGVFLAYIDRPADADGEPSTSVVAVDPQTGEVLGKRPLDGHLTAIIYDLHATLLAGDAGHTVVGIVGLVGLVSIATGIYLWWPRSPHIRRAFIIKRGARGFRLVFDLHGVHGIYASVVLLAVVVSGVYLVFPLSVTWLVNRFAAVEPRPAALASIPDANATPLSVGQAVALAKQGFPGATLGFVVPPDGPTDAYRVVLRQPGEVRKTGGSTAVWLDQYSGKVLAMRDPRMFGIGNVIIDWQFPLHNGEAFRLPGRLAVFISGLVPLVLYVTGFILWWTKRKARHR